MPTETKTLASSADLCMISEGALAYAHQKNIDAVEISLQTSKGFSVTARKGEVETLEHHQENSFSVTVIHQQCTGHASSTDFSKEAVIATIDKAITFARYAQKDPFSGLADPALLARNYPDCDLMHPWSVTPKKAITMAILCEQKALAHDKRILYTEGATVSTHSAQIIYANSLNFMGEYRISEYSMGVSCVARGDQEMEREGEYTIARNPKDLWTIDFIAKRAAEKTIARLNAQAIKTQTCPVIFEASVARGLLGAFVQAISGGALYRQSSFLLNALETQVFPTFIHIAQEPHLPSAMGSCPFDGDGVLTRQQHYVEAGILKQYALSVYAARKLGMQTTGNAGGVFNLSVSPADFTLPELLKKMQRGLLITELMGQGINITTGDYSRGAAGFWVEQGEIQFPVHEITVAGNLKNMFKGIVAVGNDVDTRSTIRTGSLLIDQMTIAGE
ncbi:MAG: metalloprotease PmbA [Gammaproteobacteria bacterium RIFCSPHIGHO2_12_FULL_42_13]|nr:MAG: metalloprotease PmbA [Gammaproteobacteria bacterium RIFCSPHIGHO2_12_FULL_42_13]